VIEAKRHGGERFGSDRLRVGLLGSRSPEHTVDRVRAELQEFGAQARDDDAAVVAVRRRRAAIQLPHPSDRGALDVARLR
jgi:serine phosphatase RsbU (regulator of sigma subunit)